MSVIDIEELTIEKVQTAFRNGSLKVIDLVDAYLKRIDAYDRGGPFINSIITINPRARDEAEAQDKFFKETGKFIGKLHGVPVVIKDQIETKGIRTTYGSIAFNDYIPSQDATVIQKLKQAGAIVLAKTNLPDFATAWAGVSSSAGHTKNPYDLYRDPGGSSSGTGAAVAANMSLVGIGEDTGGSIRVPSSFNNLFGLKVGTGLISRFGISPLVHYYDSAGPMCRTVSDLAIVLDSIAGYDPNDRFTSVCSEYDNLGHFSEQLDSDSLKGRRVGVLRDAFGKTPESTEVNETVESSISAIRNCGAEIIDPVTIPNLQEFVSLTALYGLQSRHDINDFIRNKKDSPVPSFDYIYEHKLFHEKLDLFHNIYNGPKEPWEDKDYYKRRLEIEEFRRAILGVMALKELDALVYPTVQIIPPTKDDIENCKWTVLTFPTNTLIATQSLLPAISMPAGFIKSGVPVGIEIVGKQYHEQQLINFAYSYEKMAKTRKKPNLDIHA